MHILQVNQRNQFHLLDEVKGRNVGLPCLAALHYSPLLQFGGVVHFECSAIVCITQLLNTRVRATELLTCITL